MRKEQWGYAEIQTEIKGNFLKVAHKSISSDMFAGNSFEFNYYINHSKLINGINVGKIIFKTHNQVLEYVVNVDNRKEKTNIEKTIQNYICDLYRYYLSYKLGQSTLGEWAEESLEIIKYAKTFTKEDLFLDLYKHKFI